MHIHYIRIFLYVVVITALVSCGKGDTTPTPDEPPMPTPTDDVFTPHAQCVVLDITRRSGDTESSSETGRNLYSAEYIVEVAGLPTSTTTDLSTALKKACMIILSSPIKSSTFNEQEWEKLSQWVNEGGCIISPALVEVPLGAASLFGVSGSSYNKTRTSYSWGDNHKNDKELEYADQAEEKKVSIGNAKEISGEYSIKSYAYTVTSGETMASYNTGEAAVIRKKTGRGTAYTFGVLWRDVIQRSQLNKDFSASRSYSNDFEPSADVYALFLRSTFAKTQGTSVWKFTIPAGYQTVLIPTHDCDSRTAYDQMHHMSTYEKSLKLKAHYFLTVHYYRDSPYLSAFYDDVSIVQSKQLLQDGHTVGSHSIGHFPDFSKTERFPITPVSKEDYRATHDVNTGITTGGSTWAEIALSRQIIEEDLGNKVRSFRSGHLTMNKNFPITLQEAKYSFSSCYSAGDVLSEFPYMDRIGNEWVNELSSVLQIPLHFSDVINSDPMNENNWSEKPTMWLGVLNKLKGNYAPSVLLIHPNREWKMLAQKMLIESLDLNTVGLYNFEDYGDFWLDRRELRHDYCVKEKDNKILIQVNGNINASNTSYVFGIDCAAGFVPKKVIVMDSNKNSLELKIKQLSSTRYLAYL